MIDLNYLAIIAAAVAVFRPQREASTENAAADPFGTTWTKI
jgi:hypothetical protein